MGSASASICFACRRAYCEACAKEAPHGYICPECGTFSERVSEERTAQERAALQARSLWAELPRILGYPLKDLTTYLALSAVIGLLGLLPLVGSILATCIALGYGLQAYGRAASGDLGELQSTSGTLDDLLDPIRLALAVAFVTGIPALLVLVLIHPADSVKVLLHGTPPTQALLVAMALVWMVVYQPAALMVAGQSRSWWATLNPIHGLTLMGRMGTVYWQAWTVFLALYGLQAGITFLLSAVPLVGTLAAACVTAYAYLAIGCTLGLAVFKRAADYA